MGLESDVIPSKEGEHKICIVCSFLVELKDHLREVLECPRVLHPYTRAALVIARFTLIGPSAIQSLNVLIPSLESAR